VLAAVFAWAAWSKIVNPRTFVQAVRAYDATPEWLSKGIGYGLPVLELTLAVLLLIGLITRYAAVVVGLLMVVFIAGIVQAEARGIKLECGCFGGGGRSTSTSYTLDILRDVGLLILAAYLIIWPMTKWSVDEAIVASEMVPGLTTKQARSEKNLKRYRAALAAAETELKHKQRYVAVGTAAVVILVSIIAIGVQGGRAKITAAANTANATITNGVTAGNKQAPVTVDVYEDMQCPICNNLEQSGLTKDFDAKIKATTIQVNYHVMSFLDSSSSGNKYSSRAANAAYCAADVSPDAFLKFHDIAFGKDKSGANNQPAEGSNGRPDSTLIEWGKEAGITSANFSTCVTSNQHKDLVAGVTENASKRGVTGTPTVFVEGIRVGSATTGPTVSDIDTAIGGVLAHAKSTAAPSPTPSTTAPAKASTSAKAPAKTAPAKTTASPTAP
jgi:protein-disulfide isomerase